MTPSVCAIMLTRDRPLMAARALWAFREQSYPIEFRFLYMYDSGDVPAVDALPDGYPEFRIRYHRTRSGLGIGELRNNAINWASMDDEVDLIVTWDDDDWSHPKRIEEQVALLQSTGADIVGYSDLLFWREFIWREDAERQPGEAWLYRCDGARYVPGATTCYSQSAWAQRPFSDKSKGEDSDFVRERKVMGVSSIVDGEPRMICTIHGGNTMMRDYAARLGTSPQYTRAPEWDAYCEEKLK